MFWRMTPPICDLPTDYESHILDTRPQCRICDPNPPLRKKENLRSNLTQGLAGL